MSDGASGPDATIHRRRLRNELRKAREQAAMTQRDVAKAMDWSLSKLIRIETGTVNISTNDLRMLLALYAMEPDRITALVDLAKAAREVPRWNIYRDVVSAEHIAFLGYESSASVIRNYEPQLVPGLLQTEDYAREVMRTLAPDDAQRADALIDLRMHRQQILDRENPPELHFIMDEAVLYRMVGGLRVTRQQLLRLRELADHPHVTMRVVPFTAGLYRLTRGPYVLFEFPDPEDEYVLYLESAHGHDIIRENSFEDRGKENPLNYLEVFWQLEQVGRREEFRGLLDAALSRLGDL